MRGGIRLACVALLLWGAVPVLADPASDEAGMLALRAIDLRVATVAYRLAAANGPLCADTASLSGVLIHDAGQYDGPYRVLARRLFHLGDGPGVMAIVPGSPADLAGLRADDRLVSVNGAALAVGAAVPRRGDMAGVAAARTLLAAALAAGPARIEIERGGQRSVLVMTGQTGCASDVELTTGGGMSAKADGRTVLVTAGLATYAASDDELATIIGHEMAHNALRHRARLDALGVGSGIERQIGPGAARVRETEREADYVGLYLMARAGYDIAAAAGFWRRYGAGHGPGAFGLPTHPSWRKRERDVLRTVAEIGAKRARGEPLVPGTLWPEGG